MALDVYLLPDRAAPEQLAGRTVVVIDVLRATTTITQALSAGASEVIPCSEVAEARRIAAEMPDGAAVLGGERGGLRIDGFHLGNSPAEYTPAAVAGKTLVFTTTNGTRAMERCRTARRVVLGTFNNLSAIVSAVRGERDCALLCAGTDGLVTAEDVLFAGAVIHQITSSNRDLELNDEAFLASRAWCGLGDRPDLLLEKCLRASRGGCNLLSLGMAEDVAFAARIDTTSTVAELLADVWRIRRVA
jgi:2-phosphosulfolactate phosphatase